MGWLSKKKNAMTGISSLLINVSNAKLPVRIVALSVELENAISAKMAGCGIKQLLNAKKFVVILRL